MIHPTLVPCSKYKDIVIKKSTIACIVNTPANNDIFTFACTFTREYFQLGCMATLRTWSSTRKEQLESSLHISACIVLWTCHSVMYDIESVLDVNPLAVNELWYGKACHGKDRWPRRRDLVKGQLSTVFFTAKLWIEVCFKVCVYKGVWRGGVDKHAETSRFTLC